MARILRGDIIWADLNSTIGRGVLSFLPVLCLVSICGCSFSLPTGDGIRR